MQTNQTAAAKETTPEAIEAKLHLTPQQKVQFKRIVIAGMKVMFSKQSHQMMVEQLDGPGTISEKLGKGIAGLVAILMQESKNSLPPDLLIPAGMVLLAEAAQWLNKAGTQVSDQDIANGIDVMMSALFHAAGIDPDKLAQAASNPGARAAAAKPTKQVMQ